MKGFKRHGSGDSFARLADCLNDARRYLAKRGIPDAKLLHTETIGRPIIHIAYKEALDRLENWQFIGCGCGFNQFGIFLKGFTIVWEKPKPLPREDDVRAAMREIGPQTAKAVAAHVRTQRALEPSCPT
jgi:hypothetical protein